uniref:Protein TSSC1-like n=1 Tax=Hirondellea gigas TaxID=1518452 RepID=A0A6A7GAG6_9CRUS
MFGSSAFYGLKFQGRCLAAQLGETECHRFFVGTHNVREPNEIHLVEYDEEVCEIVSRGVYSHPPEVETIHPHPTDALSFFTCYREAGNSVATLWKLPESADDTADTKAMNSLEQVLSLEPNDGNRAIHSVVWDPTEYATDRIIALDRTSYGVFNLDQGCSVVKDSTWSSEVLPNFTAGCFDPHHAHQFVSINDTSIRSWDLRTPKVSQHIENAHRQLIRDIDYNPNKPYHIVTGGEDRAVKFWDLRKSSHPLIVLSGSHTHWVCKVKYNRFHDQLVISGGTDHCVKLWGIVSISSAPLGELEDHGSELDTDRLIGTLSDHEESVYSLEWSACDAWIFASLSYDGRVIVSQVPSTEKYKILL